MDIVPGPHPNLGEYAGGAQASQILPGGANLSDDEQFQWVTTALLKNEDQPHQTYAKHEWRPLYLRRWVLLSCSLLCISLIIAVEILSWYSTKNNGLAESNNHVHYLWTYGPTGILTVISAIWTRTDYQAKLTAPWNRLAQGPAVATKTLLLDYIDPLPPVAVIRATRNGDFGVAAAATIALLWSLVIVFSASLINLTPTDSHRTTVPVDLTTRFKNDSAALEDARSLSYYNMLGLQQANLTFPEGISGEYVYQKFNGRTISPATELQVTVDGFSASLVCEEASYHVYLASWIDTGYPYLNFTMASNSCQITSGWFGPRFLGNDVSYYARFGTGSCQNSSNADDQRIAVTFGSLRYGGLTSDIPSPGSPVDVNITRSVNLLCRPTYMVEKVDVVKNGSNILNLIPSSSPGLIKLGNVHAWDITQALIYSTHNPITASYVNEDGLLLHAQTFNASDMPIDVDPNMYLVLGQQSGAPPSSDTLLNTSFLQGLMIPYYRTYAAFIINDLLTEAIATESTGQAVIYQQRLLVNATAAHAMAAILAVSVLLFGVVMITMPDVSVLACAPSNISGVAKLTSHSDTVIRRLKGLGKSDSKTIATRLKDCGYMTSMKDGDAFHQGYFEITETNSLAEVADAKLENSPSIDPVILQVWSRAAISVLVLGVIGALEATLQVSQRNNGIGVVPAGSPYLHYSWTTVPALILTGISLVYGAIDSNIRKLTPYVNLSHGSKSTLSVGLDLSDLGVPRMLLREIRTRSFAALGGTLAALTASLLATFSSSLFVLNNVPSVALAQLQTTSSINNHSSANYTILSELIAPLILESNLSYPKFTYETLIFPDLLLKFDSAMDNGVVLNATIPAVRPKMDCRLHDSSSIVPEVSKSNELMINVTEESCFPTGVLQLGNLWSGSGPNLGEISTEGVVAGAVSGFCGLTEPGSNWVYFWADVRLDPDPTFVSISALVCNESIEAVDVFTSFIGADLTIDPDNVPIPNEATVYDTTAAIGYDNDWLYDALQNGPSAMIDNFFSTLVTSPYAIPLEYLRDASKSEIVRDAIIFQHGIIRAQKMNDGSRVLPERTNALARGADKSDAVAYSANVTGAIGETHVVQDAASTRILQALLIAVLVFSLGSWAVIPKTRILPREPTSIASVIALLADGNMFELLPKEWQLSEEKDIESLFNDITFKMGWVEFVDPEREVIAGGDKVRFSIYGLCTKSYVPCF
ncbi:hypothetical protein F5Y19DRAFT_408326 [Xylariaceae sp. FL1651]|nr:hypothetical protein F5Y19DRAFT_408326 [Xylariaceae sp. FL1651]